MRQGDDLDWLIDFNIMEDYAVLISAISDVGYWRWWSENLPDFIQLEFGGVQLYQPPEDRSKAPSSLLALRFQKPSKISFIQRDNSMASDWITLLREDKIESFTVSPEECCINDDVVFRKIGSEVQKEIPHFEDISGGSEIRFAFWAGSVGMRIESAEICLYSMQGRIEPGEFSTLHQAWWKYWREYWEKRDTSDAFPKDYRCEVTIPIKAD